MLYSYKLLKRKKEGTENGGWRKSSPQERTNSWTVRVYRQTGRKTEAVISTMIIKMECRYITTGLARFLSNWHELQSSERQRHFLEGNLTINQTSKMKFGVSKFFPWKVNSINKLILSLKQRAWLYSYVIRKMIHALVERHISK